MEKQLLTREEAAHYLGVKEVTLRSWASKKRHLLPYRKVGRKVEYSKSDLDQYIRLRTFGK